MKLNPFLLNTLMILSLGPEGFAEKTRTLSQYGITWTFEREVEAGRFITGDWWVLGPVRVLSVSPAPGPADKGESFHPEEDNFGETGQQDDRRMRNGSQLVETVTYKQGYDSRVLRYDPGLSLDFPLKLRPDQSLISTVSYPSIPNPKVILIGTKEEQEANSVLRAAAVLTCLDKVPPADAFRPPYAGKDKPLHRLQDMNRKKLPGLHWTGDTPSYSTFALFLSRPWIDTQNGWASIDLMPAENMPNYGREYGRLVSMASLMLLLDEESAAREKLLVGFVQLGIDNYALSQNGGDWNRGGGLMNGRKWPILFSGILLNDEEMQRIPDGEMLFQEDTQTYYGNGFNGDRALWQMVRHHGPRDTYEEKDPHTWKYWDRKSEAYRVCCTSQAWVGQALSALLMEGKAAWNHNAFFDYCDRWMEQNEEDMWDSFVVDMWAKYRKKVPEQSDGKTNLKWTFNPETKEERTVPNNPTPQKTKHRKRTK